MSASPLHRLVGWLSVDEVVAPELRPSWNVTPGRELYAVVDTRAGTRRLGAMRWGLVPSWSADAASAPRPINARAESLVDRPSFADALVHRRCLVPVDGFFEWQQLAGGARQPYYVFPASGDPLALAGLWDRWVSPGGEALVTMALITVAANRDVSRLHDRMPAVLAGQESWDRWLDLRVGDPAALTALLRPAAEGFLALRPVSPRVSSVAYDDPELLAEVAPPEERATLF